MRFRTLSTLCLVVAAVLGTVPSIALAGDKPGEGTKFYMEYRAAFAKAKSIDEVLPYLAKERVAQVQKTPKEDRAKMFEMIKMMDVKDVKITKETKTPTGITLEATGVGGMADGPTTGTITIVREDGKLKIDKESWKS
jgi:hypothetical protein